MFSKKMTLAVAALLAFFFLDACAQWSPGGTVVYMGDLNLAGDVGQSESGVYVIGSSGSQSSLGSSVGPLMNDVPMDNSSMSNSSLNNSSINNASVSDTSINSVFVNDASIEEPQALAVMDLSSYAKDRAKGNLTNYTNIMYPLAGLSTASTAGGGGGGGCGC